MIECNCDCLNCPYPDIPEECEELEPTAWELGVMSFVQEDLIKDIQAIRKAEKKETLIVEAQSRIAQARKKRGMSQTALASAIGCCPATVCRWENGRSRANWDKLLPVLPELGAAYEDVAKHKLSPEERTRAQAWIARVRKSKGMKQRELAAVINYTPSAVCHWEKGRKPANWDQLCAVLPELEKYRPREETEQCGRY